MQKKAPSLDQWLAEAKADPNAGECGMYLVHNGTVRRTSKAAVRQGKADDAPVAGMLFDYDEEKAEAAIADARRMPCPARGDFPKSWLFDSYPSPFRNLIRPFSRAERPLETETARRIPHRRQEVKITVRTKSCGRWANSDPWDWGQGIGGNFPRPVRGGGNFPNFPIGARG